MSVFTDESTLYVGLVKQHSDTEWIDIEGNATSKPIGTLYELLRENEGTQSIWVADSGIVYDGYGNEEQSVLFQVKCVTEADAMSLKSDIEDWNEQQIEDCFCYSKFKLIPTFKLQFFNCSF